jgi:hypothetical protein
MVGLRPGVFALLMRSASWADGEPLVCLAAGLAGRKVWHILTADILAILTGAGLHFFGCTAATLRPEWMHLTQPPTAYEAQQRRLPAPRVWLIGCRPRFVLRNHRRFEQHSWSPARRNALLADQVRDAP